MFKEKLYDDPEDLENDPSNKKVWLSIKIGNNEPEKIIITLFNKVVPKTADNFLRLCKGEKLEGKDLHYKNSTFHRLIKGFMI